ncbi:hypothetical protein EV121DRAFT_282591 [Schizophyllum commune]
MVQSSKTPQYQLKAGAIAGIIVAAVCAAFLYFFAAFCLRRHRRAARAATRRSLSAGSLERGLPATTQVDGREVSLPSHLHALDGRVRRSLLGSQTTLATTRIPTPPPAYDAALKAAKASLPDVLTAPPSPPSSVPPSYFDAESPAPREPPSPPAPAASLRS